MFWALVVWLQPATPSSPGAERTPGARGRETTGRVVELEDTGCPATGSSTRVGGSTLTGMTLLPRAAAVAGVVALGVAAPAGTLPVAAAPAGTPGNGASHTPDVSGTGRYVVFASDATNLVPGDTNGKRDIFLRDTVTRTTRLVSTGLRGRPANGPSYRPTVSDNGRYVAFTSTATNLVAGDTNRVMDAFRADLTTGTITRISVGPGGRQANKATTRVSMNATGTTLAFDSDATNLIAGDTNAVRDVFVRDLTARAPIRISLSATGKQRRLPSDNASVSPNGNLVGFTADYNDNLGDEWITSVWQWSRAAKKATVTARGWNSTIPDEGWSEPFDPRTSNAGTSYQTDEHTIIYCILVAKPAAYSDGFECSGGYDSYDISTWGAVKLVAQPGYDYDHPLIALGPGIETGLDVNVGAVSLSGDGTTAAFTNHDDGHGQVTVWDIGTGKLTTASTSNG